MASSPFPLLELPEGVETKVLSFLSSADGGLQSILNLRATCSTTRSWVDSLPPDKAFPVFSRSQVTMTSDVDALRRFSESAPPFGVSALSLQTDGLDSEEDASAEETALWGRFSSFWTPKLVTLELRRKDDSETDAPSRRVLELLEFPNLRHLSWDLHSLLWEESNNPPSSFLSKLRSLVANNCFLGNSFRSQFYSQLGSNRKLRSLTVNASPGDFADLRKLIDLKKNQSRFELKLDFRRSYYDANDATEFRSLALSIVASQSTIRLKVMNFTHFDELLDSISVRKRPDLLKRIEFIGMWNLTANNVRLLGKLPGLKTLGTAVVMDPVDLSKVTFPPRLAVLGLLTFAGELPPFGSLPQKLTTFGCGSHVGMTALEFAASLKSLDARCPSLTTLSIKWRMTLTKLAFLPASQLSTGFLKLKSLTFRGELGGTGNLEFGTRAVLFAFPWDKLALCRLALSFTDASENNLPLVGEELLAKILEGPSAKTLLTVEVGNEVVSPEGLPSLEKLRSLASDNWKAREEKEGRGEWQRLYGNTPS